MRSKRKRILAVALVAVAALLGVASCGSDDQSAGGTMTMAVTAQPDALDPALSYVVEAWEPMWLVYTPLLTYRRAEGSEGAELIPGLAESLPEISEDGRTYSLTLREGVPRDPG